MDDIMDQLSGELHGLVDDLKKQVDNLRVEINTRVNHAKNDVLLEEMRKGQAAILGRLSALEASMTKLAEAGV